MIYLFLALALALWLMGRAMNVPRAARMLMIALLYAGFSALAVVTEGTENAREWLAVGIAAALVWVYSRALGRLRTRTRAEPQPQITPKDSSVELDRNARHIVLREIGGPGQKRLKNARVLVVGAGGLGSPALQYLAAAGIGTIGIIDHDVVDNSNLQRQVIHTDARIGMPKVFSAEQAIQAQNPFVAVRPYNRALTADIAPGLFDDYDLILDGTDDPDTRYLVNETAVRAKLPLISAAISQWEGQISIFDPSRDAPCYACVFPKAAAPGLAPSCAEGGVLGPLPGVLGTMMAVEAVKLLAGAGQPLLGRMLIYDALYAETRAITVNRRADCAVCGNASLA
jgi:molybdopterin/thiamine biosynthesis adenylyltransferase